jgi:integrase
MDNQLKLIETPAPLQTQLTPDEVNRVLGAWLMNRSRLTRLVYEQDLRDFARHLELEPPEATLALQTLLSMSGERAQLAILEYLGALRDRSLGPSTIRRRLSTLRSFTKAARILGLITWQIEIEGPSEKPPPQEGPSLEVMRKAFEAIEAQYAGRAQARLRLVMRLLYDLSFRAFEPGTIDYPDDLELDRGQYGALCVRRKKKPYKEPWDLTLRAREALNAWLEHRGEEPGPLLHSFQRGRPSRLSKRVVHQIVTELGDKIGKKMTPNGIRHTSNTTGMVVAQAAGYTLDEVMQFTSHRDPQTLLIYKDQLREAQGKIAQLVSDALEKVLEGSP